MGAAAIVGSLATAFVALAWLSFSFQVLLYGAAWVRVREEGVPAPVAPADGQWSWALPHRRQNRAVAESDRPQLTQACTPPIGAGLAETERDLLARGGPQGVDPAGRDRRPAEEGQTGRWLLVGPFRVGPIGVGCHDRPGGLRHHV